MLSFSSSILGWCIEIRLVSQKSVLVPYDKALDCRIKKKLYVIIILHYMKYQNNEIKNVSLENLI